MNWNRDEGEGVLRNQLIASATATVDGALCDLHVRSSSHGGLVILCGAELEGSIIGTGATLRKTGNAKVPVGTAP
jgi:hypothetical protein